jgi:hypothetical protein
MILNIMLAIILVASIVVFWANSNSSSTHTGYMMSGYRYKMNSPKMFRITPNGSVVRGY